MIEDFLKFQKDRLALQIENTKTSFQNGRITFTELKEIRKEIDLKLRTYRHIAEDYGLDFDSV